VERCGKKPKLSIQIISTGYGEIGRARDTSWIAFTSD